MVVFMETEKTARGDKARPHEQDKQGQSDQTRHEKRKKERANRRRLSWVIVPFFLHCFCFAGHRPAGSSPSFHARAPCTHSTLQVV